MGGSASHSFSVSTLNWYSALWGHSGERPFSITRRKTLLHSVSIRGNHSPRVHLWPYFRKGTFLLDLRFSACLGAEPWGRLNTNNEALGLCIVLCRERKKEATWWVGWEQTLELYSSLPDSRGEEKMLSEPFFLLNVANHLFLFSLFIWMLMK